MCEGIVCVSPVQMWLLEWTSTNWPKRSHWKYSPLTTRMFWRYRYCHTLLFFPLPISIMITVHMYMYDKYLSCKQQIGLDVWKNNIPHSLPPRHGMTSEVKVGEAPQGQRPLGCGGCSQRSHRLRCREGREPRGALRAGHCVCVWVCVCVSVCVFVVWDGEKENRDIDREGECRVGRALVSLASRPPLRVFKAWLNSTRFAGTDSSMSMCMAAEPVCISYSVRLSVLLSLLWLSVEPVIREVPGSITVWPQVSVPLTFRPVVHSGTRRDHSHSLESGSHVLLKSVGITWTIYYRGCSVMWLSQCSDVCIS